MNIGLILIIVVLLLCLGVPLYALHLSQKGTIDIIPEGYEDENGFHEVKK